MLTKVCCVPSVWNMTWYRSRAKLAVTMMSATTLVSVRGFCVEPSLQLTKRAWASGTAVTWVPSEPLSTGWDVTPDELQETAARIVSAKKWFNILSGWQPAEDTLPGRFFEESPENDPQAVLTRGRLHELVKAYNQTRGWSPEGWMDETVRTRLGLGELASSKRIQETPGAESVLTKSETA